MKQRWTWLATAALFLMQPAAEVWAQTTTTTPAPAATACPNCPNGGVPKRDGTGMKKQRGNRNHQMGKGQHKGMHRGMQQQQQGPGAGGGLGRGGGGGMMRGGPRGGR